jgi:hypothetical protein
VHVRARHALIALAAVAATSLPCSGASAAGADDFSTARHRLVRSPATAPLVTAVRTVHHRGYDRVVVRLSGAAPGFDVRYVRTLIRDGSGLPVDLLGPASLSVVLLPANGHDPSTGTSTITTPLRTRWRRDQVRETAVIGDFEAVFTVGVGLHRRAPFRVLTLRSPTRIVVDVRH